METEQVAVPLRSVRQRLWLAAKTFLMLALGAAPVAAQGWIEPTPGATDWGVVKLETDVTVRVEGRVAEVVVEEWFENRGGGMGEGDYVYPLPGEAVFSNFSLYQGDEELRGEAMDAEVARGIYEEIVRRNRDPALIELVGHGLIRARVFPIEPGQRRRITLRYTQLLERAGESAHFRYAAGVRTGSRRARGGATMADVPLTFTLLADAGAYGEPFSPTHRLRVERRDGSLRVRPAEELSGGFSVFLPLASDAVGVTVATHRQASGAGYFMLTLSPGAVPRDAAPRDITAVVDVSGSMSGSKIEQTRAALHQLLGSLGSGDRFRLVAFNNLVRSTGDGWSDASPEEFQRARQWIDALRADGGTDIGAALEEALRLESPDDRLPIVVFLTDGLPTVGQVDPERIADEAEARRGDARIFAFGVGYDVNTYLLDRLGVAGRGSTEYVEPGADVETALARIAAKITHPVLTDLRIQDTPVRLTEVYPLELPDLFAGEELVVFGRYEGAGEGPLAVAGRHGSRSATYAIDAHFPQRSASNDYIPRLWASRKLGELTRQIRVSGPDPELVEAVRTTALRYGLLSEYTSYLVQEPGTIVAGAPVRRGAVGGAGAAGAPQQVSGEAAVKASVRAGALRAVASAADLDAVEMEQAEARSPASDGGARERVVAGRVFVLESGKWVQRSARAELEASTSIALFSDAYFAVLRALPELEPVVKALPRVSVRGERTWIRFDENGERSLSSRQLERLVAEYRGQ